LVWIPFKKKTKTNIKKKPTKIFKFHPSPQR